MSTTGTIAEQMLATYPKEVGADAAKLADCIRACMDCAQACTACADACLSEDSVADLTTCISSDLDCADLCSVTAAVLTRRTSHEPTVTRAVLEACATACRVCGAECERHATHHDHCRICAEACGHCEQACRDLLATLG